jgi:hypothetical protein
MTQNKTQDFMTFESKSAITSWIIKFNHLFFNESEIGAVCYIQERRRPECQAFRSLQEKKDFKYHAKI